MSREGEREGERLEKTTQIAYIKIIQTGFH